MRLLFAPCNAHELNDYCLVRLREQFKMGETYNFAFTKLGLIKYSFGGCPLEKVAPPPCP